MAHMILQNDKFGEVRSNGQRAWHGLGEEIPEGLTAEEGFKQVGINWDTRLLPIFARDPENKERETVISGSFLHVRSDNFDSLGVVGSSYRPIANMEMARFADALVGADATVKLETAGSLRNGRRVYCSVRLPKTIEVVKDDILEMYVILSNAHDGSAAFHTYPSSIRPVCANTLGWSERDLTRGLRIQHTGQIEGKVDKARQVLGLVVHEVDRFAEEVKMVHRLGLTKAQALGYFNAVYRMVFKPKTAEVKPAGQIILPDSVTEGEQTVQIVEGHQAKIVGRWMELLDAPQQQVKGISGTGWAAYNAFSQWSDHERGNTRGAMLMDSRIHSNVFGISQLTKKRAWKQALQLA